VDGTGSGFTVDPVADYSQAMDAVSTVRIAVTDPRRPEARQAIAAYYAELAARFESGFDPARSPLDESTLELPAGLLLVATRPDSAGPIGCGALRLYGDGIAEVKRLWVSAGTRGLGLGRRLLSALEALAVEHHRHTVRLETNRVLTEAIAMYRSTGYREVPAFNDEPYAHHWFEKALRPPQ
jgi:ribosomal protein S18 acetylase RimI-like enzyme